ncbi:hypothetical protein [Campylobacter sp. 7477a]|uniref:hypothetical protein n=1 Tax=Campylobacter sp. 7477a TaxID=2735741 RepID=UPI00301498C3|nr:hypothetical protein [Campylobacter sp. 7477a]
MRNLLLLVLMAVFFVGCGAKGPQFTEFKQVEADKSLLYVYRESVLAGGGVFYDIHVDTQDTNTTIGTLKHGGYLEAVIEPNIKTEIWAKTEAKETLTITPKAKEIYCVKGGLGIGFFVGHPKLSLVDLETCKKEIAKTQLSQ